MNDQRQKIIASVFSKRNAFGALEETYVSHVKIWEDAGPEGGGRKPRYILLSQASNGSGFMHKSKLNTNGSFSVGKTWRLAELRAVQVVNPLSFNVTLSRTYRWETENEGDQTSFIQALVRLFRAITQDAVPLQVEGLSERDNIPNVRQTNQHAQDAIPSNLLIGAGNHSSHLRNGAQYRAEQSEGTARSFERDSVAAGRQISQYDSRYNTPSILPGNIPAETDSHPSQSIRSRVPSQVDRDFGSSQVNIRPDSRSQSRTGQFAQPDSPANSQYPLAPTRVRDKTPTRAPPASPSSKPPGVVSRPRQPSIARSISGQPPLVNVSSSAPRSVTPSSAMQGISNQRISYTPASSSETTIPPVSAYPLPSASRSRQTSPSPSNRSRKPSIPAPTIPPSNIPAPPPRRDRNARISYFDPSNQAMLDRLIVGGAYQPEANGDEESAQATMSNVEEMIEGYEWATDDVIGRKMTTGTADLVQARLLDELMALDKANIHSFLESDDRIGVVLKYIDGAIAELDNMDSLVSSYKIHLNAVSDDILFIQSQNRGLQVQTQNQKVLLNELENLLQTVHVDQDALSTLTQESLEKPKSIQRLEEASTLLYKALQAGRDTDMAATMERLQEYRTHNSQFCKRMFDFLSIMFTAQSKMLLGSSQGIAKPAGQGRPTVIQHQEIEAYLGRYAGLMLYLKEMDENIYGKLCAAYFSAASSLHSIQIKALLSTYLQYVKKVSEDELEQSFSTTPTIGSSKAPTGIRRAGTIIRSPLEGRNKDKDKNPDGDLRASEVFGLVLEQMAPLIYNEDDFITDFLQINDAALTFADYMGLEQYFRRQATRFVGLSQNTMKLVHGAMDLIFGFLPDELKSWLDSALAKDSMEIIGVLATLERFLFDAEEKNNEFFLNALSKQHNRLKGVFDRHVKTQIQGIEQTKLTSKKRKGVTHFVKHFPIYIGRVEAQLIGADELEVRASVDAAYEKIVQSMFDSLKQMAKMDRDDEDKGQLNYHVILIENMHHFVAETTHLEIKSVAMFSKRAEAIYEENLSAYVKIVLRRPFTKIIDYFEGVERLLKNTAPTEVASNSAYNRSALKKVVKEYNAKDVRKNVDVLFKRVEKHFTEASEKTTTEESSGIAPGTVMVGVWKACEEELIRITELFSKRISQCYADSGVSLEYSTSDVEAAFRRHRVGF